LSASTRYTNPRRLITARAFQGLGGGSIMGLTSIIVSDISPLEKRGAYQGIMGASWGVAAVVGPIIGGALTQKVSWRWCFYINLPTCAVAFVMLFFGLNLNKPKTDKSFAQLRKTFDFVGLLLIMIAGSLLIVGFSFAADHGFDDKVAVALIVVGGVAFFAACANCLITKRNAVIPAVSKAKHSTSTAMY
jgi:MFS family permease